MNVPFRASSPADLLATIPMVLGFWPSESLVVISMRGTQLSATLRVDLPPVGSETGLVALTIAEMMAADTEATSFLCVIYTEPAEATTKMAQFYGSLVSDLQLALPHEVKEGYMVTEDLVLNLRNGQVFPVQEVHESPLMLELMMTGKTYSASSTILIPEPAGDMSPEQLSAVAQVRKELDQEEDQGFASTSNLWHNCPGISELDESHLLILLATLHNETRRDLALVNIMSPQLIEVSNRETMKKFALGSKDTKPDWERADRFTEVLQAMLTIASGQERVAPLALMGVIAWYKGRSSVTDQYMRAALAINPNYTLASLITQAIELGAICVWAQDPKLSYPGFKA